jgi:glycosyltransferase involved in cell wall biosynthesis
MKNCIIISESYNFGATGIVVKDIIKGFVVNKYTPLLVTYNFKEDGLNINRVTLTKTSSGNKFLNEDQNYKAKIILFKSFTNFFYTKSDVQTVQNNFKVNLKTSLPKFILVIVSGGIPIRLLRLAYNLSKFYKIPFIIHSTDPLPSPIDWGEKKIYRTAVLKAIEPFYRQADLISASNPLMLSYQLSELNLQTRKSFVLYCPTGVFRELNDLFIKKNTFLYLGSLYGKRDPKTLVDMFLNLLNTIVDARLIFVGSSINLSDYSIPKNKLNNFETVKWTDNPEKYIEESEILLDYNADIENDVFIASKLIKYIGYSRKILVLSAKNSAPEQFIANQQNIGIWNASFSNNDFIEKAVKAMNTKILDWSKRQEFCNSKNAHPLVEKLIDKIIE